VEIVHLQKLHEKLTDKGLVVLGYNCQDSKEIARALMEKHKITFPSVLDASQEAIMTAMGRYKMGAVPMTYVIDRDGKVAASFIGYKKDDPRGMDVLKKLGIQ
jgi:peroxiredoxin